MTETKMDLLISFLSIIVSGFGIFYSYKANKISNKANNLSKEANKISKDANKKSDKANEIAKKDMNKGSLSNDFLLLLEFFNKGLISEWTLNVMSERSLKKYIDKRKKGLKQYNGIRDIEINDKTYKVFFDYIIDEENKVIYSCEDNRTKKDLYDGLYSIIDDFKFIKGFITNDNFKNAIESFLKFKTENKNVINKYKYKYKSENYEKRNGIKPNINQVDIAKTEEVCKLWSYSGSLDKEYEKLLNEHMSIKTFNVKKDFEKELNSIKKYYLDFYYFNEILCVYKKSDFEKNLYQGG